MLIPSLLLQVLFNNTFCHNFNCYYIEYHRFNGKSIGRTCKNIFVQNRCIFECTTNIFGALKQDLISLILMGKLGISHQNSDKGCNCKLFFLLLPFHFALLPASVSLSYLHFFTNIDFIQEQKYFSFWTRQILISTFTHPNTSTFPFTVNYSFLQIYSKFLPLSVFYVTPIPL